MPKLIREGRFGPPGSFKTGATVGTYPRPLFVFSLDDQGLSIIKEPITYIPFPVLDPAGKFDLTPLQTVLKRPLSEQPPITAIDFSGFNRCAMNEGYTPMPDPLSFKALVAAMNVFIAQPQLPPEKPTDVPKLACPFKTLVFDNTTAANSFIMGHQSVLNPGALADARKWAPNASGKVKEYIQCMQRMNAHCITLMHSDTEQNELTKKVSTQPMIFAKFKQLIAAIHTQFFYSFVETEASKPRAYVYTQPPVQPAIEGIRCNWPSNLPPKCGATFNEIYGKEQGLL